MAMEQPVGHNGSPTLRVLQLNLFGRSGRWEQRRETLVNGLRALRPDLLALEETILTDGYDQVEDLLGSEFTVWHQGNRAPDGTGVSMASRWPLQQVRELELTVNSRAAAFPAVALIARITVPGPIGPLLFVNHKPTWQRGYEYERELQAVRTARELEKLVHGDGPHVVVAGDFDAVPDTASVRFWTGRQSLEKTSVMYRDAWEAIHGAAGGHTFTPDNAAVKAGEMPLELGRRIDYVLVRSVDHGPTLRVAACELAFAEPAGDVWASDHFGVLAELAPHPHVIARPRSPHRA
jgi:endonuclease/exonuclease/phosphatase family metal-dependent hydrolase